MLIKHIKALRQIRDCIRVLELDLSGYEVLTEVGSNNYLYTPLIASLAGASKVNAWTRDTKYGKASDIINECEAIRKHFEIKTNISFHDIDSQRISHIESADIITNSGFLRPLNSDKLKHCKKTAVIPLMYEAWELRREDIDIEYCNKTSIKVAGTWENHPSIGVFNSIKHLAIKLSLEAGYEVYQNKIIVWSDDEFGEVSKRGFEEFGAKEVILTNSYQELVRNAEGVDFIFLCDYDEERKYLSEKNGIFDLTELQSINQTIGIVHLYGDVDYNAFNHKVSIYPNKNGFAKAMSETLGYLGLKPIINLQVAGFRVAQEMLSGNLTKLSQPII